MKRKQPKGRAVRETFEGVVLINKEGVPFLYDDFGKALHLSDSFKGGWLVRVTVERLDARAKKGPKP